MKKMSFLKDKNFDSYIEKQIDEYIEHPNIETIEDLGKSGKE